MDKIFNILNKINYSIEAASLLDGAYEENRTNVHNIIIEEYDEYDFLDLREDFTKYKIDIINYSGGYKIIGGPKIINVLVVINDGNSYNYRNNQLRLQFKNNYMMKENLYPLKMYKLENTYVKGPNNPIPYLRRVYNIRKD